MKRAYWILILVLMSCVVSSGQTASRETEIEIRKLDQAASQVILKRDESGVDKYFHNSAVTNNPRSGLTIGAAGIKELFKTNVIDYASFERNIESVQLHQNTAIVMGNETVVTRSLGGRPGETIRRRYTNVWMKTGKSWQIVARHANVICP